MVHLDAYEDVFSNPKVVVRLLLVVFERASSKSQEEVNRGIVDTY